MSSNLWQLYPGPASNALPRFSDAGTPLASALLVALRLGHSLGFALGTNLWWALWSQIMKQYCIVLSVAFLFLPLASATARRHFCCSMGYQLFQASKSHPIGNLPHSLRWGCWGLEVGCEWSPCNGVKSYFPWKCSKSNRLSHCDFYCFVISQFLIIPLTGHL